MRKFTMLLVLSLLLIKVAFTQTVDVIYNVTREATPSALPAVGASVKITYTVGANPEVSETKAVDAAGNVTFTVPKPATGNYSIAEIITLEGYNTINSTSTIRSTSSSTNYVYKFLLLPTTTLRVLVTKDVATTGTPITGASVTFSTTTAPFTFSTTVITDANGIATLPDVVRSASTAYSITIAIAPIAGYASFTSVTQSISNTASSALARKDVAMMWLYPINLTITNATGTPIAGASVKITTGTPTSAEQFTDANGKTSFTKQKLNTYGNVSYTVTAAGYADSTGTIPYSTFVDPLNLTIKLRSNYNITFTVTDGTNPVAGANIKIGTTTVTTDAAGVAVFTKKVNGNYPYIITKTGIVDKSGIITVSGSDPAPAIIVNTGYDLTFTVINGLSGTTGLQNDSITIDGITKISDAAGIVKFGVAPGSSYSFDNKKAGFKTVPVSITNIQDNTALTIYMEPVYTVKFQAMDPNTGNPIMGATVVFNNETKLTDGSGTVYFYNVAASATSYDYTVTGPGSYNSASGTQSLPLTSTASQANNANRISINTNLTSPLVYFAISSSGGMSYYGNTPITFDGIVYTFDPMMGGISITCALGTHTYIITPDDVTKAVLRGTVEVTAGNPVVFQPASIVAGNKIEMYVVDETADQNTIDDAIVTLDGEIISTVGGYVVFERKAINTNYPYTISKTGYGTVTGIANLVTADLVITSTLHATYKVTAKVYDNTNWSPEPVGLAGATVLFNGISVVTDADGVATFPDAVSGSYDYTISKTGFLTVNGSAQVNNADLTFETYLNPAFSVQFTVTDGTNPIANASVRLVSSWPVFDQTFVTDEQGVLVTDKLFPKWASLDYTISATGFADSKGTANIANVDLVVDPIALQHAYEITFTVTDGTNPVADAAVIINNVVVTTNAGGTAVFQKMINGDYNFMVSKAGFIDIAGTVTVADAHVAREVSLAAGYDVTFNVINGPEGTVGLANDTITLNGISKITDATGTVVFGVASGTAISFANTKAGFADVQVDIAGVTENTVKNIYMVPVYNIIISAFDANSYNPIAGATIVFNGTTVTTDDGGVATFPNIQPAAGAYAYSVTGNGTYNSVSGEIMLPFTSTEEYLATNNVISKSEYLSSPSVYIGLAKGMMSYFGNATISVDGVEQEYNAGLGGNSFNCVLGTHTYVVTPANESEAILRGMVEVTSEQPNASLWLNVVAGYTAEIYTIDQLSEPIEGASVTFGETTVLTDATGLASFKRYPAGNYTVSASKDNYSGITSEVIELNTADVLKLLTLNQLSFTVTVNVTSGTEHLEGASVTLDGVSLNTDANGNAVFSGIPAGTYPYTVTKAGTYADASGSVIVIDKDVTENVNLINTTGITQATEKAFKVYPNPTSGNLNINLPDNKGKEVTVRITNIIGSVLLENRVVNGSNQIKLDVSGFGNGIYFVTVKGSGFENTMKVVKK